MSLCTPWVDAATVSARPDMATVTVDPTVLAGACLDASTLLYALSGRQFPGACTATVRPVDWSYGCNHVTGLLQGLASGRLTLDSWTAATNGGICGDGGLDLGLYPVRSITQVKINGQIVDPSLYRPEGQRWLVRPGVLFWPTWQRLDLPDTADGTFSVTVTHGADPPPPGISAAAKLAAELAKSRVGAPNDLPRRITNLNRQQVSMTLADPMTYLDKGRTGIFEADVFIAAYNPGRQYMQPAAWSPELAQRRKV
jgi:hypothetical protein